MAKDKDKKAKAAPETPLTITESEAGEATAQASTKAGLEAQGIDTAKAEAEAITVAVVPDVLLETVEGRPLREISVMLPSGRIRVYSERTHGKVWRVLAKNYAEAWGGKYI